MQKFAFPIENIRFKVLLCFFGKVDQPVREEKEDDEASFLKVDDHDQMQMMSCIKAKSAETGKSVSSLESVSVMKMQTKKDDLLIQGKWKLILLPIEWNNTFDFGKLQFICT